MFFVPSILIPATGRAALASEPSDSRFWVDAVSEVSDLLAGPREDLATLLRRLLDMAESRKLN